MSDLLQLDLADFIPSYAHFGEDFREGIFDIYHDEPENVFYKKKEFYKNKLGPTEDKPPGPGIPLQTQNNISRFLSARTLNDEMLLFHGMGSGKCVHPDTTIYITTGKCKNTETTLKRIEDLWNENVNDLLFDGSGEWSDPINDMFVNSLNTKRIRDPTFEKLQPEVRIHDPTCIFEKCIINHLYRQYIEEKLYIITLECGKQIKTTGRHKLLTENGEWIPSSKLTLDVILSITDEATSTKPSIYWSPIKSIDTIDYKGYVYDLEITKHHNYIANGIVTHNTCSSVTISELSRSINPYFKPTLVLVKGGSLKRNFVNELAKKCTKGQYIPDNYDSLTKGERVLRMNRLVNKAYDIQTFETFAKSIDDLSDQKIRKEYSNRTIIIDEVHNIRIQPKKKKKTAGGNESVNVYDIMHRFLHSLDNRKIILMSGTPMRDRPEEFASVMNLILPLDKQLPTGKDFTEEYFNGDKLKNKDKLKEIIRGRVSYVRSMESGVTKNFKGAITKNMKKIRIYPDKMGDFQTRGYIKAYNIDTGEEDIKIEDVNEEDEEKKSQGLYDKSRQASLFVFPDGTYGSEGFNNYVKQVGTDYTLIQSFKDELTNHRKATVNQIIDNIRKYSVIYAETIDEIVKHPDENIFVYNKYVQGSGAILFAELLKLVGFERSRGHVDMDDDDDEVTLGDRTSEDRKEDRTSEDQSDDETSDREDREKEAKNEKSKTRKDLFKARRTPRYSIVTGETVSEVEVDRIIDKVFNDPRNKNGRYLQVIIGSQIISEGKSLKNVRQIHIQTPHWNNSETEQAIARGIRAFSHDDLRPNERYVKVYRHAAIPKSGIESINYIMFKTSEDKDFKMKQIERVCKESSVDCALNKGRNLLPSDVDGTRECDYLGCNYKCDFDEGDIPADELIDDTYNLYYAEEEIESIVTIIKQLFRKRFSYDLTELMGEIQNISSMIIVRALKHIIDKSIELINRYGMPCFLREDHNLYFLVDEVTLPNSFLLGRYTQHPNVKPYYKFEDIVRLAQYRYIEDKIYILENFDPTDSDDKAQIILQINSLSPILREIFLEMAIIGNNLKKPKSKALRKVIIEHFRNYITELPDKTVSTLLYEDEEKLRCLPKNSTEMSDWYDCGDTVDEEIENVKLEEKVNLELNPYGYYGIMAKKFKDHPFKIMKVEATKKDGRKNLRGPVCMTIVPKQRINDIIDDLNKKKLNIQPPIDIVMKDKEKFISDILKRTNKFEEDDLNEMSNNRIKSIYYWYVKAGKKDMCDTLQNWFTDKELMMYEK